MKRISTALFATVTITATAPGCIVDHGLGQTASDTGSTGGSDDIGDTEADPSATGTQMPTAGDATATGGDEDTDPSATGMGMTDDSGTEGTIECVDAEQFIAWEQEFVDPMPGIEVSFAAVLGGDCSYVDHTVDGTTTDINLSCTLSGRIDADADIVEQAFSPTIRLHTSDPVEQWLPVTDLATQDVHMRLFADWWGMGWNRYLVLEFGDQVLLDVVDGEYIDPAESGQWADDLAALLDDGELWHGMVQVDTAPAPECDVGAGECNGTPQSLAFSWQGEVGGELWHPGGGGVLNTPVRELSYQGFVSAAFDIGAACPDTPLGDYRFALWALTP